MVGTAVKSSARSYCELISYRIVWCMWLIDWLLRWCVWSWKSNNVKKCFIQHLSWFFFRRGNLDFFLFFFLFFSHWVAECCQLIIHFSHNVENVIRYSGYRAFIDLIFANGNLIINIYNNASLEYNIDTIHLCMPPLGISISESVSF